MDSTLELLGETTLRAVVGSILKSRSSTKATEPLKGLLENSSSTNINISNISVKKHATMRNAFAVTFSINKKAEANEEVSVLMIKDNSNTTVSPTGGGEVQAYLTLFKDMQCPSLASSTKLNIFNSAVPSQSGNLYSLIPRPYFAQKPYLILEDLQTHSNYKTLFNENGSAQAGSTELFTLDFNHCLLTVETLARFHASSYLLRRQFGEKGKGKLEMLKKYPFINSQFYTNRNSSKLSPIFEKGFELACKLIELENPSLAFKLQRKVPDPSLIFDKIVKLIEEEKYDNDDFYVVCHGSFLAENLLFQYNKNRQPVECRIVNLGSVFMGPMASDLALFMLTSTTLGFREQFEEKLLAFYCDAFQEQISTSAKYASGNEGIIQELEESIDEFHIKLEKQYKKMLEFGFYHACLVLPLIVFRDFCCSSSTTTTNSKHPNNNSNYYESETQASMISSTLEGLISDFRDYIVGGGETEKEFEEFAMNNSVLHERLVGIVKQLVRCRVMF